MCIFFLDRRQMWRDGNHLLWNADKMKTDNYDADLIGHNELGKDSNRIAALTIMALDGSNENSSNEELHDYVMACTRDFKYHGRQTVYSHKIRLCDIMIKVHNHELNCHNLLELDFNHETAQSNPCAIVDSGTTQIFFLKETLGSSKKTWLQLFDKEHKED